MMVIDASVAVKWIIEEPGSRAARELIPAQGGKQGETLAAPALILVETHHAVRKRLMQGEATSAQLAGAIPALVSAFSILEPLDLPLVEAAIAIAMSAKPQNVAAAVLPHAVADCVYIAMTRNLNAALATADLRQAEIARAAGCVVRFIED